MTIDDVVTTFAPGALVITNSIGRVDHIGTCTLAIVVAAVPRGLAHDALLIVDEMGRIGWCSGLAISVVDG